MDIRHEFANPPDDCRIMMRWWWFGPAVSKPELERELRVMKAAGIGGVEIQPVYPLELEGNMPYLADAFLDAVRFTAAKAKELGMRVDVTLGSGWPYGGPHIPVTRAAGRLRMERGTKPALEDGEKIIAELPDGGSTLWFVSSRTGQQVKRPSIGAEGFVLDHYDRQAIELHLTKIADRLLNAFGPNPPYAVFSDSLEVYDSDWTSNFLDQFKARRRYDLKPHLRALIEDAGPETGAIRHDWGKTLTELAEDNYLTPLREWAHAHHTRFRSQTYGQPPVMLSSNALVDLPEGERGPEWRKFNPARWASSASHLYGRPITSTETWTWLHSPAFRATPLDLKAEADLHFVQGINQLVGHGWPYSPATAGEPGWRFYAAAALNEHNPWFEVMPDLAKYLRRVSFVMRQGKPANDVAIYLPTDDAWARFTPGKASVDETVEQMLTPQLIPQILTAGYNFDFIDDRAIESVGLPYRILLLPNIERIPLTTLQRIQRFANSGGFVIATGRVPSMAPGFRDAETDARRIVQLSRELFKSGSTHAQLLANEGELGSMLHSVQAPDLAVNAEAAPVIGFMHRALDEADIYFIANTSNRDLDTDATARVQRHTAEIWDPFTAEVRVATRGSTIHLKLAPYESCLLVFSDAPVSAVAEESHEEPAWIDVSGDWSVTFEKTGQHAEMARTAFMGRRRAESILLGHRHL